MQQQQQQYRITHTWDGQAVPPGSEVQLRLSPHPQGCLLEVQAPLHNDPPPPASPPGQTCPQLWDFEVVEAFFLNDKDQYLEVELCPHGQHLLLQLSGRRNIVKEGLPVEYTVERGAGEGGQAGGLWQGKALLPAPYFPPRVSRFNAFAIHGSGESRQYLALHPAPPGLHPQPDFHRLEYFQSMAFQSLVPGNATEEGCADVWKK